jgi:hypothetical protein
MSGLLSPFCKVGGDDGLRLYALLPAERLTRDAPPFFGGRPVVGIGG